MPGITKPMMEKVYAALEFGGKHRMTSMQIAEKTHMPERTVRDIIEAARREGYKIVATTNKAGYFKPLPNAEDLADADQFIASQKSRGHKIFLSYQSLEKWTEEIRGQQKMSFEEDGQRKMSFGEMERTG